MELGPLLEGCRRGDELAWEALVRRLQGPVYAVAYHYLRDREEARDVAQDAFIQIYRNLDKFEGLAGFKAWVMRVTRNCAIDRGRRLRSRPPLDDVQVDDAGLGSQDSESPQAVLEANEKRTLLRRAIARMSDINGEMIMLKEIQGLTQQEVADLLSIPLGTVKARTNRARVELARRILELDGSYGA